ncbi:MAG: hypothetical protein PHS34_08215 [Candidatus Omnitrophica bacterium]|nr:hypothetical protein [Candidatus Omnitrophota bacterium]
MTKEEAKKRIEALRKQGRTVFDLTFQEQCVPYVKEEVTELSLSTDDFHFDWKKEIVDYKKDFVMALSLAAGIEVVDQAAIKEGMFVHKSTIFVTRKMPTGMNQSSEAAYCFDVETRAEKEFANDAIKFEEYKMEYEKATKAGKPAPVYNVKYHGGKYCTENNRLNELLKTRRKAEMAELGASRADTSAHLRAIKKLIQIPSAQKKDNDRYIMVGSVIFVSKVTPNLENSETRRLYLGATFGNRRQIEFQTPEALPDNTEKKAEEPTNTIQGKMENLQDDFDDSPEEEPKVDYNEALERIKEKPEIASAIASKSFLCIIYYAQNLAKSDEIKRECLESILEVIKATSKKDKYLLFLKLCLLHPIITEKRVNEEINELISNPCVYKEDDYKRITKRCRDILEETV